MIIFDTSSIAYILLHQLKNDMSTELFRHAMLNKIGYIKRELEQYACTKEVVIACDSRNNWRKEIFAPYKAERKKNRESQSDINWDEFFNAFNTILAEFKENMPFKVLQIDRAEADDIIAILCQHRSDGDIVIVSPDKDFRQLCKNHNKVKLYSPIAKVGFIDASDYELFEHVLIGDSSDGVPNVLSEGTVFVDGNRQTTLSAKKKQILKDFKFNLDNAPIITDAIKERIDMNTKLIDLTLVPEDLIELILEQYDEYKLPKGKVFNYFVKNKLTKIMESGVYK